MLRLLSRCATRRVTSFRVAAPAAATAAALVGAAVVPAAATAAPPPISFAAAAYYPTGQAFDSPSADENGTAAGDLLGNGRQDVVSVDQWEGNTIVIQYGNGNGTFSSPGQIITIGSGAPGVENVVTGKFTSSGRVDIVVLAAYGFYFLRNDGGGHFTQSGLYQLEQAPFQDTTVAADFNGDRKLDLAIKTPQGIQVEVGNGSGGFSAGPLTTIPGSVPGAISSITLANVNGGSTPGLFAADAANQQIYALAGNGSGGFTVTGSGLAPFVPGSVAAVNDTPGGLDSAVALDEFNAPGTSAALLVNNGSGGFQPAKTYDGGSNPVSAVVGDFNHDGIGDVVSSDVTGSQQVVLAGNGGGGLAAGGKFATGTFPQSPVVADFNGDGKPDIAVTSFCPGAGVFLGQTCLDVLINES